MKCRIFLFTVLVLIHTTSFCQKISEGHFQFGLLKHETIENSMSTEEVAGTIKFIEPQFKKDVFFNKDCFVEIVTDPIWGNKMRTVILTKNKLMYVFNEGGATKTYRIDSTLINKATGEVVSKLEDKETLFVVGSKPKPKKKIQGFLCEKVEVIDPKNKKTILLSAYLAKDIPYIGKGLGDMGKIMSGFPLETTFTINGIKFTTGAISFTNKIPDRSVFSIETVGFVSEVAAKEAFQEKTKGTGENLELYKKLLKDSIIHDGEYESEMHFRNKSSFDLLTLIDKSKYSFDDMDNKSVINTLEKYQLVGKPTVDLLRKINEDEKLINPSVFLQIVNVAALKETIDKEKCRGQIATNLNILGYNQKGGKGFANTDGFINGASSFTDLLLSIEGFNEIKFKPRVASIDEFKAEISSILRQTFGENIKSLNLKVIEDTSGLKTFSIGINDITYKLREDKLRAQKGYDEEKSIAILSDTFEIESYFKDQYLAFAQQIDVDMQLRNVIYKLSLGDLFLGFAPSSYSGFDEKLKKLCPNCQVLDDRHVLVRFPQGYISEYFSKEIPIRLVVT